MESGSDKIEASSRIVYHHDRLNKLRDGIGRILGAFVDILADEAAYLPWASPAEFSKKLHDIDNAAWSRIRDHFLNKQAPPVDADLEPGRPIAQLVLDFTNKLDDVKKAVEDKLETLSQKNEVKFQQDVKTLQKKLAEEKQKNADLTWKQREISETSNSDKHSRQVLKQQLKEKQEIIAQLQRNGTVQLWEKEKRKLLEGSVDREEKLTRELAGLRETHEETKDRLQNRIKDLEDKLRLEKMKDIVSKFVPKDEVEAELEDVKRQLYTRESNMARMEQELINQQKIIVGCLKGLQRDLRVVEERQQGGRLRKDDMRKMNAILDAVLEGAREGRLDITKADLPLHYIAVSKDIIAHPGIARKATTQRLLSTVVNRNLELIGDSPEDFTPLNPPPSIDITQLETPPSSRTVPSTAPPVGNTAPNELLFTRKSSAKAKLSVDDVKSTRAVLQAKARSKSPSRSPVRSPLSARKNRTTSINEASRSPGLLRRRRAVSTPVPPDRLALLQRPSTPHGVAGEGSQPAGPSLPAVAQPSRGSPCSTLGGEQSRSPTARGQERNRMAQARGPSEPASDPGLAGNGSVAPLCDQSNVKKPRPRSVLTGPGGYTPEAEHPSLIDYETELVDTITARICFPHMSEEQIREHFKQFKKYDANKDYNLDFVELTQAIQSTVSDYYKPRQIKEAMVEIDVDRSDSIDFYEYLGVSTMLHMKVGKSELFRSSMVKHAGGSISKVCSIQ